MGFARARRGDLEGYRRLALEAARRAQTSFTLYHLGLALPPREGVVALEEALQRAQSPKDQGLLALVLARTKRRLGRLREALAHAALARLKAPGAFTTLEWAWLTLLAEEEPPLPDLLREVEPLALEPGPGLRVAFLQGGRLLREGPTRALLREWAGEGYLLRLAEPVAEALAEALGPGWLAEGKDHLVFLGEWGALKEALPRVPVEVLEISRGEPSLEIVFLRLFGREVPKEPSP
ncbi:hypothetical protein E0687_04640 [Thermus tengchongensis]|uniref:Tetratricopeptide repeat protein n=1 Tax=Thermus tengchongensis TaxID=1214928 RepID=A0A4Y9FCJ0_9DEIN|nr:hypothetical protein E0687_04640 [Thermus tengchongensis]